MVDPSFVDLLTQIIDLRLHTERVQGKVVVYRKDIDGHIAEILNFRNATTLQLEGLQKENENLRAKIIVLCRAVATLSSSRGESSKVKELENFIWDMEQYFTTERA